MSTSAHDRYHKPPQPLGRWLLQQTSRSDDIGQLAKAAAADRGFPRDGDFNAISRRLNELQADGETHAALEQADIEAAVY